MLRSLTMRSLAIPVNLGHEGGGGSFELGARLEQRPADQQHDVGAVEIKHFPNPVAGHAAGRHRHAGREPMPVPQGRRGKLAAGFWRISEAPAMVWEND